MKIFITGVAGFLGSHLADSFISQGYSVAGNDNLLGGDVENLNSAVEFYECDCCDYESMLSILKGYNIVIHAAATAHEGFSVFSPNFITRNIYQASVATFSAAIAANVSHIVFCSSMARYGHGNYQLPFIETQPPRPVDPYGIAKVAAEDTLRVLCDTHSVNWNIIVPHNIIGARQKYNDPYRNVTSIMANRNLQGKPAIIYGNGQQKRCFSHIDDCVSCFTNLINQQIYKEIINIGPDETQTSIIELANLVSLKCNFNQEPLFFPGRPLEVENAYCSADKARKLLNYKTTKTLNDAVDDIIDYIKTKGVKDFNYNLPLEIKNDITPITWQEKLL